MNELVNKTIINHLRKLAEDNTSVLEILLYIKDHLYIDNNSRIVFLLYITEAFSLSIKEASIIGAWDYFNDGYLKIEDIDNNIRPLINERRWGK